MMMIRNSRKQIVRCTDDNEQHELDLWTQNEKTNKERSKVNKNKNASKKSTNRRKVKMYSIKLTSGSVVDEVIQKKKKVKIEKSTADLAKKEN